MKKSYEAIDLGKLFVSEYYHSYGATAVDSLAKSINALEEDTKKYLFTEYLQQDYQVYDNCKGIAYQGTYVFLNDIGFSSEWENLIKYWDEEVKPKFKPL